MREEFNHSVSLPKILVPSVLRLKQQRSVQEMILEVQLPNILFGVQVFWELQLEDSQTRRTIKLRYRLRSGANRISLPLELCNSAEETTASESFAQQYQSFLSQFQRGLYRSDNQCFYVRDWLCCLHMRYRIQQPFELAIITPSNTTLGSQQLDANSSTEPLSTTIYKFAQEGFNEQRPYFPGDDPRRINWKLYSRFNELYVRIPEEQQIYSQDLHCYFLPDMSCYPYAFRQAVLNSAASYFLSQLKSLHQSGYRTFVHIPGKEIAAEGLQYHEQNEEGILCALAGYPLYCSLYYRNKTRANPMFDFLQELSALDSRRTGSSSSHLIFCSPHSIDRGVSSLRQTPEHAQMLNYFPSDRSLYIPLPEPSRALKEELLQKSVLQLLPPSLLLQWLLRSCANPHSALYSTASELWQRLGEPFYLGLSAAVGSYPKLLQQLVAWKVYYQHPEKRYPMRYFK